MPVFGLTALSAAAFAGCGLGPGSQSSSVTLSVTADFGQVVLRQGATTRPAESETAMRQLQRSFRVETSYAGRFVRAIDGRSGGTEDGRPVDWFYFVNGIEASVGAADTTVHGGDSIWWDFRDWGAATHVPAVVGAWPHPFTGAFDGKRPAVRVVCAPGAGAACAVVEQKLADAGVTASRGLAGEVGKGSDLRVLVGAWKAIRPDPAAQLLEQGPGASGVYLRPSSDGKSIEILNQEGSVAQQETGSTAFVAATVLEQDLPTWIVSGTDDQAVVAAANHLTSHYLKHCYAVAWAGRKELRAPLRSGK
jgi:hypothetical protein